MHFTKKFFFGLTLVFIGTLTAFNCVSTYRKRDIIFFLLGMASALFGTYMMFKGIESKKKKME